jgi:hypothetical protein
MCFFLVGGVQLKFNARPNSMLYERNIIEC